MKILSSRTITLVVIAIALLIAGIFYFQSRPVTTEASVYVDPAFAEYISSYTAGVIPSGSSLRIEFPRDMVDSAIQGQESALKLFDFSPALSGKTIWLNPRSLEFQPDERMESGQRYRANFFLSRLLAEVPEALRTLEFGFRIIPQNYEVVVVNTKSYNRDDLTRAKIEGVLTTADFANATAVEETIGALQQGRKLNLTWTHDDAGRQHHFVVEEVSRREQASTVNINVDGGAIGSAQSQDIQVSIPSLNEFKLVSARVIQSPTQYVVLQFSDPLKENQNLAGLITIAGLSSLDFDIHENEVWVYPPVRQNGHKKISISAGIRNALDKKLEHAAAEEITFEQVHPGVRFVGKGSILPSTDGLVVPFEAVNLHAVDIQVIRIYEENVLQFFQVNNIEGNNELRRVGNRIIRKKLPLLQTGVTDPGKWNRYTLDISELINAEPGALYEIRLGFKMEYSTFACAAPLSSQEAGQFDAYEVSPDDGYQGFYNLDYYDNYYYGENYDWRQRDNPCHPSYYTSNRSVSKNVLASDLGLTAKRGEDGSTVVFATDLKTAKPIAGVEVALYSFQLRDAGSAKTDSDGKVVINSHETPFAVVARHGAQRGYLRLANGEALMTSNFDVSGQVVQKGLKGFLYGERGVWRPGDSLHLTFILEDKREVLPRYHPVVFELSNPRGQVMSRLVRSSSENGFYSFHTATSADAPTGNWLGRVKVGGSEFTQTLKIETVKPNRLKIDLDFRTERFTSPEISGELKVKWLHGAPGRNLKAAYEVMLLRQPTTFDEFAGYNFDDPSREFFSESQVIFEGSTDANGNATINATLERSGTPSGLLNAVFRGKVYEDGGNFSIDRFSVPFYPYDHFVGLRVPEGEQYSGILHTDVNHAISIASADAEGNGVSRQGLELNLYRLDWRWWWDNTNESLANFLEGSYSRLVKSGTINTNNNGNGQWTLNLKAAEYGRYFLRVCDPVSGHCAGQVIYVDEPGWYSRARADGARGGANLLSFSTDKAEYQVGEEIQVLIPGIAQGRALVSIENGSKVLETHWVETRKGETRFVFDAAPGMAPNVYVHVSLLQPHDQTENDLPIRLYGVASVKVRDPASHLTPQMVIPDVLEAGERVSIQVSEKNNRRMTFTVAMVDEGLLDLTRFKTPDAWNVFYAREALGVRTWDVFDHVMGAFGANLERFISVGGDDAIAPGEVDPLANRFKPVVKYFGPFTIDGTTKEIQFTMPQYIGSVKTMVVAGNEGAYGSAEKISAVKKPLMVLATLPRVLGPGENVSLPVTLFSGDRDLPNVKVSVTTKGPVALSGAKTNMITLKANSDSTINFQLQVKPETGVSSIEVMAVSGNLSAHDVIEIQVRNPNLPVTRVTDLLVEAGKSVNATVKPFGLRGTNSAILEVSKLPAINLESRMRYLLQYPHGCIEQITSAVFPQLYLARVKELTPTEQQAVERNIKSAIEQLRGFVQADGGFGYWPGVAESTDSWGTSYAGHFLIEAESKGYYVPADLLSRWKDFQRSRANAWRRNEAHFNSELLQAYRLYTLALSASPELGAMNRLREENDLSPTATWMLASAYAVSGQKEAARNLTGSLSQVIKPYREMAYSYGSHVRDKALILETLILLDEEAKAFDVLKEIAEVLGNNSYWMNTQETAMCLRAYALFAAKHQGGSLAFDYRLGKGKPIAATTGLPVAQVEIAVTDLAEVPVLLNNKSEGVLFARLISTGTPGRGEEQNEASNLVMETRYTDRDGNMIDPSQLEQGTQIIAEVVVRHPGVRGAYENLALSQVFPSGWEISNLRLTGDEAFLTTDPSTYQDVRDDRVFTYFNLAPNEEKIFRVSLTAAYTGSYYLPGASCEAMYDAGIYARKKGQTVSVAKPAR